jgi:hypothetical protein
MDSTRDYKNYNFGCQHRSCHQDFNTETGTVNIDGYATIFIIVGSASSAKFRVFFLGFYN